VQVMTMQEFQQQQLPIISSDDGMPGLSQSPKPNKRMLQ